MMKYMSFTIERLPTLKDLHPAVDKEGLLLRGYASTWTEGPVQDRMSPYSLDAAVKRYMATNPILLYQHKVNLPPIGKVIKAEIHRAKGLWIEAILPKPKEGTFAYEVWESAKNGLLKAL